MKRFFLLALVLIVGAAPLMSQTKCGSPPAVTVSDVHFARGGGTLTTDRAIDGAASREGRPLAKAPVRLYEDGKVIRTTVTDEHGRFLLDHLRVGHFRLVILGVSAFDVEVTPPHMAQQALYTFFQTHDGCPAWGADSN
jgi:hypothetical protein